MIRGLKNIAKLYVCPDDKNQSNVECINNGALIWENGKIVWVGEEDEFPSRSINVEWEDANGGIVVPGLIDAHTHLAFGGWREDEFVMRIKGESYLKIAEKGGGILSSVRDTRAADTEELFKKSKNILDQYLRLGVTCVEAKTGYGLSKHDEIRILEMYRELSESHKIDLIPTFLGAHTVPPEYKENRDEYIRILCEEMLPEIASKKLARFCDAFVEESAFTAEEVKKVFSVAKKLGFGLKLHADQITNKRGAELAACFGAISADHLESISKSGLEKLSQSKTIAVSLPIANLYLKQHPLPIHDILRYGIPIAVATDFNPGTAPSFNLHYAMHLACVFQRMTPDQVLKGATIYAARAVSEQTERGSLESGKRADFAVLATPSLEHWMYHFRPEVCTETYILGERVFKR